MTPKEEKIYKIYVLFEGFWGVEESLDLRLTKNGIVAQLNILIIKNLCPNLDL